MQDQISRVLRMQIHFSQKITLSANGTEVSSRATEMSLYAEEQFELVRNLLQVEHIQRFEEEGPAEVSFLHRGFRPARSSSRSHQHLQRSA